MATTKESKTENMQTCEKDKNGKCLVEKSFVEKTCTKDLGDKHRCFEGKRVSNGCPCKDSSEYSTLN